MWRLVLATLGFLTVVPSACEQEILVGLPSDYEVVTLVAE